jgi:hypothetical protein
MTKNRVGLPAQEPDLGEAPRSRLQDRPSLDCLRSDLAPGLGVAAGGKKARAVDVQHIKFDVANENDRTHALTHDVDVLLNNAVIMEPWPLVKIPMPVFRSVCETNVFAAIEVA